MQRILFLTLFGVTLAVYGVMLAWSLPTVSDAAGGLAPFDMRPSGYSFAEAQELLTALPPEGVRFYREVQQTLDLFYPVLLALTLFFANAALAPKLLGLWRWVLASLSWPVAVFDYLENQAVGSLLAVGASGLTPEMVASASRWTVLKSSATTLAIAILLAWLCLHGARTAVGLWRCRVSTQAASHNTARSLET